MPLVGNKVTHLDLILLKRRASGATLDEMCFVESMGLHSTGGDMPHHVNPARTARILEGYLAYRETAGWPSTIHGPQVEKFARWRLATILARLAAAAVVALMVLASATPASAQVEILGLKRTLQAAATTVGPGATLDTMNRRHKSIAIEFACPQNGTGTIWVECSVDDGQTFDKVLDTTFTATDGCQAPPLRCLVDIDASCTQIRAPISAIAGGCVISAKAYAEP